MTGPPAIQAIENQTLTEGGNMTLTCLASEGPSLVVSWIKPDGQHVNTNILKLITIKRSEAGEYRCVATIVIVGALLIQQVLKYNVSKHVLHH